MTAYRTAATSAAALDRLAPAGPVRLAVPAGLEASMHVGAFHAIREIEELVVYSPTSARRAAFAAEYGGRAADEPRDAVKGATVVLAARRAASCRSSTGIGCATHGRRVDRIDGAGVLEIDVSVVGWCDLIVCDDVDEVSREYR